MTGRWGSGQTLANELTNGLNRAMERGEFKLYLQPKFSLKDFSVIGAEALVRWEREDGTVLYPDQFIPILETTGRIVDLDLYMFEQVAEFLKRGIQDGLRLFPIAVNASVALAKDPENARRCENILQRHQVSAELLEIELTETAAVSEFDCVKKLFACFQEKKMQTSLDDFGAGYSVLNSVVDIPINTIKLDRGFIARCAENQRGIYFLQQVVNMVKSLGYQVICEGIETREQVDIMRTVGCDSAQGFWILQGHPGGGIPGEIYEVKMWQSVPQRAKSSRPAGRLLCGSLHLCAVHLFFVFIHGPVRPVEHLVKGQAVVLGGIAAKGHVQGEDAVAARR